MLDTLISRESPETSIKFWEKIWLKATKLNLLKLKQKDGNSRKLNRKQFYSIHGANRIIRKKIILTSKKKQKSFCSVMARLQEIENVN